MVEGEKLKGCAEKEEILQEATRRFLDGEISYVERRVISEMYGPFAPYFTEDRTMRKNSRVRLSPSAEDIKREWNKEKEKI